MERNEACELSAFAAFDMGLEMNIDAAVHAVHDTTTYQPTLEHQQQVAPLVIGSGSGSASGDLVAAARFDFLKKKRMPRFRRSGGSAAAERLCRPFTSFSAPPAPGIVDQGRLAFLFSKKLQKSDVGVLKRIVLPKKAAETHLPALVAKEGTVLEMDDLDGMNVWCFKYRFWPNNNSRMYVLEGTGDFTEDHGLQVGDYIMLYRDTVSLSYVIQALKAFEVQEYANKEVKSNLSDVAAPPNINANGGFMNQNSLWSGLDGDLMNPINYPMNVPSIEEQLGMTFIYDTTYSNDIMSPLDCLGGFMTSYPTPQPNYAIDNLSFDDLYKI
ncbi:B3 domain-containing transcription factor FUS3 isoform X2 [Helianthus annuus]|uniref:B3 domain-containing transcription factor FUS3 isoform X2 n=1 Tax=Helianthus annuus TaxID=4232 RepID=UPI000B8FBF36|nr:B3 domain-containing transcription factor FUS3 isoform X2 [Helianthus annuus]